ncbi:hypothetical protein [Flavobacterium aestivum]|uniref:hypothetical protein n=1 Tax=Flavobacterium aestivum TaxID=3003257 RepID=UPI0024829597|nr:hypothetical protein [Flavobacterium aestivum]
MRILAIILIIFFVGCQSPKKDCDFTFFKWNIHETFYLKFNSSDTLYYINTYPFEEQTSFTILSSEEKEKIQNILDTLSFPKDKEFVNSSIEDGETYAFNLKNGKQFKTLKIHEYKGLNQFLRFGKSLEEIKSLHKFSQTNKKFDLNEINKILIAPVPPPIIEK